PVRTCAWSSRASGRISSRPTRAPRWAGRNSLQTWSRSWRGQIEAGRSDPSLTRGAYEKERGDQGGIPFPADRREDQGVERLEGQDARAGPRAHQAGRPGGGRGMEVARRPLLVP